MTKREEVLKALFTKLKSVNAAVLRGEALPERIDPKGTLILRDGSAGEPSIGLSPLVYSYTHRAEIEVICQDSKDVHAKFDTLLEEIRAPLLADRTLGGKCDWLESGAPEMADPAFEGPATKAGVVPITIHYSTSDPLR